MVHPFDPERAIFYANPAASRMFHYPAEQLIGANTEVLHASPEHYKRFHTLCRQVTTDLPYLGDFEMRRGNGEVFPTSHLVEIFTDQNGKQFVISVVRDESERKRMESELRESEALLRQIADRIVGIADDITVLKQREDELRQAQKMESIGQLSGGIAHDFNILLVVMLGHAESLVSVIPQDSPWHKDLNAIIKASERAALLTRRLLAFSRRQSLRTEPVDLNDLIHESVQLLSRTLGTHIAIKAEQTDDLWPVALDREQFETSLLNLAINARDAMPDGGELRFTTANCPINVPGGLQIAKLEPGDYVRVTVEDTGSGMPDDVAAPTPYPTTRGGVPFRT